MDKDSFISHFNRESETTKNVLKAIPTEKFDFKPTEVLRTAAEIALILPVTESVMPMLAMGELPKDWPPDVYKNSKELVSAFEKNHKAAVKAISAISEEDLQKPMDFWGQTIRRIDALWIFLLDNVHHRGQLTVYIRMFGGVVPSIYGPTLEKPM